MKIVALLPESMGDFILTTPSLQSLESHFKGEEITWVLPGALREAAELFQSNAHHCVYDGYSPSTTPDITFCFPPATRYYWLARKVGGKQRAGYVHEKMWIPRLVSKFCLTDHWICPSDSSTHELQAYGKILSLVNVPFTPQFPSLVCEPVPQNNGPVIAIHLSSRWKNNPLPQLKKIAQHHPSFLFVALFSRTESQAAQHMCSESNFPQLMVPGPQPLKTVAAWLRQSRFLIAVDGGLVHLTAALGTPSLIFYPEDDFEFRAKKWHPWNVPYQAAPLTLKGINQLPETAEGLMKQIQDASRKKPP